MQAHATPTQSRGPSISSSVSTATPNTAQPRNAALAAALKGATLAFQGQANKTSSSALTTTDRSVSGFPNPQTTSSVTRTDNGALRAATQATRDRPLSRPRSPTAQPRTTSTQSMSRQTTAGSVSPDPRSHSIELGQVSHRLSQHLLLPGAGTGASSNSSYAESRPSASYIAATLAASRSGSPSPTPGQGGGSAQASMPAMQLHSRITRRPSLGAGSVVSMAARDSQSEVESIQPTDWLISLFEGKKQVLVDVDPVKKRDPAPRQRGHGDSTQAKVKDGPPTPPRPRSPGDGERGREREREPRQAPKTKPKPPPSVVVRAATFKDAGQPDGGDNGTRSNLGDDVGRSTEDCALCSSDCLAKSQPKPPVVPRKPSLGPKPDAGGKRRPSTPPALHDARRPAVELVSPEPRRIIKTPRLDPPQLPPRTATSRSETDLTVTAGRHGPARRQLSQSSATSDDTFASASSTQSPRTKSPVRELELPGPSHPANTSLGTRQVPPVARHPSLSPTPRSVPASRRPTAPNMSSNSSLALDSLTSAIMAGNLASARLANTTSSSPGPPPLPAPRRQHRTRSPQHVQPQRTADSLLSRNRTGGSSKSPSGRNYDPKLPPRTGMLQTLRAAPSSLSDDEDARRRMHRTRKKTRHPLSGAKKHAHNEGARRRWRDEVSPRERRRYEAVWASNRGLFLRPGWGFVGDHDVGIASEGTEEADLVANVVVRDIWSRSRLPDDELAEVWELVDRRGDGTLGRMQFVVGMWLVDQRLRGRKIPARVGESVWASVRGLTVPPPKKKR